MYTFVFKISSKFISAVSNVFQISSDSVRRLHTRCPKCNSLDSISACRAFWSSGSTTSSPSGGCPWNSSRLGIIKAPWCCSRNFCLSARLSIEWTMCDRLSALWRTARQRPWSAVTCMRRARETIEWKPRSMHCVRGEKNY